MKFNAKKKCKINVKDSFKLSINGKKTPEIKVVNSQERHSQIYNKFYLLYHLFGLIYVHIENKLQHIL